MVRFSCFFAPLNHSRSKKVVQQSAGGMQSSPKEISQYQAPKASPYYDNNLSNTSAEQVTTPSSHDGCWKSDDLNGNSVPDDSKDFHRMVRLKKSQSLGSVLDKRRGFSGDDVTEGGEMDQEFSFDDCRDNNMKSVSDSFENTGSAEADDHVDTGMNTRNHHQKNEVADSFGFIATPEHHRSLFSIGVLNQFDGEQHDDVGEHSVDHIVDSLHSSSNTLRIFAKSLSATNLRMDATDSTEGALTPDMIRPRSRSFEDLCSLHGGREGFLNDEDILCSEVIFQRHITGSDSHNKRELSDLDGHIAADSREECAPSNTSGGFNDVAEQERNGKYLNEKFECDNQSVGVYEPHNNDDLPNERREPENDRVEVKKTLLQDSSIQNWGELTSEEFKIKRIEEWINKIDFQNGSPVELGESSSSVPKKYANIPKKDSQVVAGVATANHGANSVGMEVAYNYISSLSASSSSAQMSNLGLVAVPFLGSFVGLRVLNLSGNAIVRITTGALPRGLHLLNLSKNTISTIEGLRDLTRLRVLDLSYNRIVRIGHGLASCSSLKELYLAGNKISEVEGLHRLLKLNILDLRFNKMSTAKGLGQLAANYGSLQAINLEGNPAQRNVRDEQLKKYLLSLLPHLVYYNKQTIKANCSKDVSDRPLRSLASHQFDRGMRTEQNYSRRGSHGTSLHRSASLIHGRSNPAVSSSKKQSKNRHVHLPPAGSKATHHQHNLGTKPLSSLPSNPIRRISSGGTL